MNTELVLTPANTLSRTDPGDDTQRRYRYQAAYAAIVSLDLLDEDSEFEEMFCEHHEDTLVRKKDGSFIGIQVKTRAPGREPFKSNDEQILNSLKRFVEQATEYPEQYSRFVLATNYAFWSEKKNSQNLNFLLELARNARAAESEELHRGLSRTIDKVIGRIDLGTGSSVSRDTVLDVLSRIKIQADLPKFDDLDSRLARHIPESFSVGAAGYDDLLRAARALINRMFEAGSLQHVSAKQMYFALCSNPAQMRVDHIVEGKRITKETVERILRESLSTDTLLCTRNGVSVLDLPRGMRRLELKMAMGKIAASSIRRTKDHKYSAERLLNEWIYKYYPEKANERYAHLSVIVGNECQEAYDSANRPDEQFGQVMLNDVRRRLRSRLADEPDSFFGCKYEHLLGMAGILTELCDVWWSEEFEILEDADV